MMAVMIVVALVVSREEREREGSKVTVKIHGALSKPLDSMAL